MAKFRVKPGEKITIGIEGDPPDVSGQPKKGEKGYVDVPLTEEQLYVFRRKKGLDVIFYDLGTRLRSVPAGTTFNGLRFRPFQATDTPDAEEGYANEYVDIEYETPVEIVSEPGFGLPSIGKLSAPDWKKLQDGLLGSLANLTPNNDPVDPLGFTPANGSGRLLSNCAPISLDWFSTHVIIAGTDFLSAQEAWTGIGAPLTLPWMMRETEDEDALETWNPLNLTSALGGNVAQQFVSLRSDTANGGSINWRNQVLEFFSYETSYYAFDTSDTDLYKVTADPDYAASPASVTIAKGTRVYLRPIVFIYKLDAEVWATREYGIDQANFGCVVARSALSGFDSTDFTLEVWQVEAVPEGTLVGVIVNGLQRRFVWTKTETGPWPGVVGGLTFGACS